MDYCSQIGPGRPDSLGIYAHLEETPFLTLTKQGNFVIVTAGSEDIGTIKRRRWFPLPQYTMFSDSKPVWHLSTTSPLRNRHELDVVGDERWLFRTPFFSTRIAGEANSGLKVSGSVGRRT